LFCTNDSPDTLNGKEFVASLTFSCDLLGDIGDAQFRLLRPDFLSPPPDHIVAPSRLLGPASPVRFEFERLESSEGDVGKIANRPIASDQGEFYGRDPVAGENSLPDARAGIYTKLIGLIAPPKPNLTIILG
jgi:hypothetical protein